MTQRFWKSAEHVQREELRPFMVSTASGLFLEMLAVELGHHPRRQVRVGDYAPRFENDEEIRARVFGRVRR